MVLFPPSECNVTWRFALCLILPTLKQENPASAETDNDKPCSRNICKNLSEWNGCCTFTTLDPQKASQRCSNLGERFIFIPYGHLIWQGLYMPHWDCHPAEKQKLGLPTAGALYPKHRLLQTWHLSVSHAADTQGGSSIQGRQLLSRRT